MVYLRKYWYESIYIRLLQKARIRSGRSIEYIFFTKDEGSKACFAR